MTELTTCGICHTIKQIKQIHIDAIITLVLDCDHRKTIHIPNLSTRQNI